MNLTDLRDEIGAADAKAAFDVLVNGFSSRPDFSVHAHEQGFLNSLRIWRGDDFCFAAIPNDDWVLAYVRKPELRRGRLNFEDVVAEFPDARLNKSGEITLRIHDAATAERWLSMALSEA